MNSNSSDGDPAPPTQDDRAELARRLLALPIEELRQAANFIVGWAVFDRADYDLIDALLTGHETSVPA